jgi:hypothetical protein
MISLLIGSQLFICEFCVCLVTYLHVLSLESFRERLQSSEPTASQARRTKHDKYSNLMFLQLEGGSSLVRHAQPTSTLLNDERGGRLYHVAYTPASIQGLS